MPIQKGFEPNHNHGNGAAGDIFVNGAVVTSGTGGQLDPLKTIQEAVDAWVIAADVTKNILVMGNNRPYRESIELSDVAGNVSNTVNIQGFGTDKPLMTGGQTLTGWVQCTIADQPEVGDNYANIYKTTLNTSDTAAGGGFGLNLHEAGTAMYLATDRPGRAGFLPDDLFWATDARAFNSADTFVLNGSNQITGITHPAVFGKYSSAQVLNASIYLYHSPNAVDRVGITAYNGTSTVDVDGLYTSEDSGNSLYRNYSLANILPAMQQGQSGFIDNGATLTVYCWPTDPANLAADIEYSALSFGFDITDSTNYVKIAGFQFAQYATASTLEEGCAITTRTSSLLKKNTIELDNIKVDGLFNGDGGGYGAVYAANIDDFRMERFSFSNLSGMFGYFLAGGPLGTIDNAVLSERARVNRGIITMSEQTSSRHYGQRFIAVGDCKSVDCGRAAHANKFNFYEQCDYYLYYRNDFSESLPGYGTNQEASRGIIIGNVIPANNEPTGSGRSYEDQNAASPNPAKFLSETGYMWLINNTMTPDPDHLGDANAINTGSNDPDHNNILWRMYNNIAHGRQQGGTYGPTEISRSNYFTSTDADPGAHDTDVRSSAGVTYANPSESDFRIRSTSNLLTSTAYDWTQDAELVSILSTHFSDINLNMDIEGNAVNWAESPIVGANANFNVFSVPPYNTVWAQFDGAAWLEKIGALDNAPATTDTLCAVMTFMPSADDIANLRGMYVFLNSTNNAITTTNETNGRVRVRGEDTSNVNRYNETHGTTLVADTEYAVLITYDTGPTGAGFRCRILDVTTGQAIGADQVDPANNFLIQGDASIGFTIGSRASSGTGAISGRIERMQLWMGAPTIDFTQSTNQEMVVGASGGLVTPLTLESTLGTPLVSIYGRNLADGTNLGNGGAFVKDGSGEIEPLCITINNVTVIA